jgi:hypothetical protein
MTTAATRLPTAAAPTTAPVAAAPAVALRGPAAPSRRVSVSDTASRDFRHPELGIPVVERAGLRVAPSACVHRNPRVAERRHMRQLGCAGAHR